MAVCDNPTRLAISEIPSDNFTTFTDTFLFLSSPVLKLNFNFVLSSSFCLETWMHWVGIMWFSDSLLVLWLTEEVYLLKRQINICLETDSLLNSNKRTIPTRQVDCIVSNQIFVSSVWLCDLMSVKAETAFFLPQISEPLKELQCLSICICHD